MTKLALKGITMLVLIISIAFLTAVVSANAQTPARLKAVERELSKNNSEPQTVVVIASLR